MPEALTIAIDAMGGDAAPDMVIEGLSRARQTMPHVDFLVFGDEQRVAPLVARYPALRGHCQLRSAGEVVSNDDSVAVALRARRNSSMRLAINAVKDGEAQGIVSAGNTGALMAMAKFVLKTMPGIDRPAIVTYFPTQRGRSVMLDLGANVECDARNLVQFAVMGEVFARHVLSLEQPSIGLLNIGQEDLKGSETIKQAFEILRESDLPIRFHGFVEGDDIGKGTVDVIVTDGFTGNVALKTAEGTAQMFGQFLRESLTSSLRAKLGAWLALPAINAFRHRVDPRRYNGAMLVGLNGICVKSHGGTDGIGFANAVSVAVGVIERGFNDRIREDLGHLITVPSGNDDKPPAGDDPSSDKDAF